MRDERLYRVIWRWHFFAGLIVLPILAWMAVTGGLYLYKAELERLLYPRLILAPASTQSLPVGELIRRAERQLDAQVTQVARPAADDESWRMAFEPQDGGERLAFIRADTGALLGTSRSGGPLELIKELHSLTVAGTLGNILVEIVAGWAILLVLTGFYLWWPRAGGRALSLAGRVGERRFWRNLHASVGALAGLIILFLALTGMPWTAFWGERFHAFVAAQQIGRPAPPPVASNKMHHDAHLPWSLQGSLAPVESGHADVGADWALASASAAGLRRPWTLDLPDAPGGTYRFSASAERTGEIRLIHIGAGTGRVLQDVRYSDFGPGAKLFEWGIYTHQGQQYGEPNRLLMLFGALGLIGLATSAPVIWWKRRRETGFSAPPRPLPSKQARGAFMLMLATGAIFPLTGATMVLALIADRAFSRRHEA